MSREQKLSLRHSGDHFRHSLGKIEKLKLMEPLCHETLIENEVLKARIRALEEKTKTSDETGANVSITQHLLSSANIKDLDHPKEFFEVLEKEKQEEVELLMEKAKSSKGDIEEIQQQKDELKLQADDLTTELTERNERLKELEEKTSFPATDKEDHSSSSSSRREREEALRGFRLLTSDDLTKRRRTSNEESETAALRMKIEELQQRVAELQSHNAKWEALCKELQQELDKVKCQLQQYQTAEVSDGAKMMASLRDQELRREQAERMAQTAKRQIEDLERKVIDLERQLAEKEQDRINAKVEEVVRERMMPYEEQAKAFEEDVEGEKRDHENTKEQMNSLRQQWQNVYEQLKDVTQQLNDVDQQLNILKKENEKLESQIEQARKDQLLIKNRQSEFGFVSLYKRLQTSESTAKDHPGASQSSRTTPTPAFSIPMGSTIAGRFPLCEWVCQKCTFNNGGKSVNCEMCNEPYKNKQFLPQPLTEIPSHLSEKLSPTNIRLEEDSVNHSKFTLRKEESKKHTTPREGTNTFH